MYEDHRLFISPFPDAVLWRYVNFTKFVSLLDKSALFFARVDKLDDPFEGSFPRGNVEVDPSSYSDPLLADFYRSARHFVKDIRPFTLVNCWHESPHESDGMWRLYSGDREGIAIRTDFKSLSESLVGEEVIHIGKVSYIDYDTARISELNSEESFLRKRKSFEYENEVRAINLDLPLPPDLMAGTGLDLSIPTYDTGTYLDVDISRLIHEVKVAPFAADWFMELVQSVADRYGLSAPINKSALGDEPTWG